MSPDISLAKINKPRLQKVLPRPRLLRLLDESRSYPATWISGPGGSGKTTLIAHFIEEYKLPCLWYQIDSGDSDISTFFYYLGLAGNNAAPEKKDLPLLTPEYILGISTFTMRFFEALLDRLKKPAILVLDNYQEVPPDSLLHQVINDALRVIPDHINVFILSRISPPPVLARARANNILREIEWPALRLKINETRGLCDLFNEKPASEAFVENLQKKTDGWIAGIILLLKKAESWGVNIQPFTEFSNREIFEYFRNEIFNGVDHETQEFMLLTSIFPRMSADMAQKLTGSEKTAKMLTQIQRSHWFIEQYASRDIEYQYHSMFREFLLNLAEQTYSSKQFRQLKKQAAELLERDGQLEAAIDLYFESDHLSEAFQLLESHAELLTLQGRLQTLMQWLRRFPDDFACSHPQIHYWMGVCHLSADPNQGRTFFEKALSAFQSQRNIEGKCLSLCGILDSISYGFDSFREIDKWISHLEMYSLEFEDLPFEKLKGRLAASAFLALSLRQPDHPDFSTWERRGMAILQKSASEDIKSRLITAFLVHRLFTGNLAEAEHFIFFYRELAQSPVVTPLMQISLKNMEAYYYWLCGYYEKSHEMVTEALKMANETGVHVLNPLLIGHDIAAALNLPDTKEAEILLGRLKDYIEHTSLWTRELFHLLNIWHALQVKDLQKASLNADFLAEYVGYTGTPLSAPADYLGQALAKQAAGRYTEAQNLLDKALAICHRVGSPQMEFGCHLARAEFALDAGDETVSVESLEIAMAIGRAHQYVTTWLWWPDAMTRLCLKALKENIEVDYVQQLIRCRGLMPECPPLEIENFPWPLRIYALGRFSLLVEGKPIEFAGKVQEKPLALLKAIISLGGRDVSINSLSDYLWPEADGDVARGNFKTTLHRLRKLIAYHEAICINSGSVTLDQRYVWVDAWAFERNLSVAEEIWESNENDLKKAADLTQKALALYKGPLFQADDNWVIPLRDHLHHRFIQAVQRKGEYLQNRNQWEKAIELYEMGLKIDELVEPFYRGLMVCNHYLGQNAMALAAYERCRRNFLDRLATPPSVKIDYLKELLLDQTN